MVSPGCTRSTGGGVEAVVEGGERDVLAGDGKLRRSDGERCREKAVCASDFRWVAEWLTTPPTLPGVRCRSLARVAGWNHGVRCGSVNHCRRHCEKPNG